jgi:hypothetical protein
MESLTVVDWIMFGLCVFGLTYGHFFIKKLRKDDTFANKK